MAAIAVCLLAVAVVAVLLAWHPLYVAAGAGVLVAVLALASDALRRRGNGGRP